MAENSTTTAKKRLFMRALLLAHPIKECARYAKISERCAYYWLADPVFQAEKQRLEAALSETEQEEIKRLSLKSIADSFYHRN